MDKKTTSHMILWHVLQPMELRDGISISFGDRGMMVDSFDLVIKSIKTNQPTLPEWTGPHNPREMTLPVRPTVLLPLPAPGRRAAPASAGRGSPGVLCMGLSVAG
ncbi:hypothetical protein [Janthinobacterium sp.]|uniref:hypothetical protein n=1 Tax=Janthinobacterium sp. TaxID=1871054 RepID=UPI0025886F87|nr:hypothetical protein [Janthinobacterium sp.]MCX7290199.1 hypothetical protein [Janthinobacterium sp.]